MTNNQTITRLSAKVVFVGLGATSVFKRHLREFNEDSSSFWSVGFEPTTKLLSYSSKEIKLQIWNLRLSPGFAKIRKQYMQNSLGLLIFFRENDRKSFDPVSSYLHDFMHSNQQMVSVVCDFSENQLCLINLLSNLEEAEQVSSEEAHTLASALGMKYYEMRVDDQIKFHQVLSTLAKAIISSCEQSRTKKAKENLRR